MTIPLIDKTIDPYNTANIPNRGNINTFENNVNLSLTYQAVLPVDLNELTGQINTTVTQMNATATQVNSDATTASEQAVIATTQAGIATAAAADFTATSTTNTLIELGSKTFAIETGKAFVVGQFVRVASSADVNNQLIGQISSASDGSITVNVTAIRGSGTFSDWSISLYTADQAEIDAKIETPINKPSVTGITGNVISFSSYSTIDNFYGVHERTYVTIRDMGGSILLEADITGVESYQYLTLDPTTFTAEVRYGSDGFWSYTSEAVELTNAGFNGVIGIDEVVAGTGADMFNDCVHLSDGNIVAVGRSSSVGAGNDDAWIVKFDNNLNKISEYTLGGGTLESFNEISIDSSDNVFIVGYNSSVGAGTTDGWIVKFDNNLNKISEYTLGGTGNDVFESIALDGLGNVFAAGKTESVGAGGSDGWIVKFDNNLNKISEYTLGGTGTDVFYDVKADSNNKIFAVGATSSVGAGNDDAWIVKFDNNLNKISEYTLGGGSIDVFFDVEADSNNNIFVVGYTQSVGAGGSDGWIVKFDNNLNKISEYTIGGGGFEIFNAIKIDADDNMYIAGYNNSIGEGSSDGWIVKVDSSFNKLAEYTLGGTSVDRFNSVSLGNDNSVAMVGSLNNGVSTVGCILRCDTSLDLATGQIAALPAYTVTAQSNTLTSAITTLATQTTARVTQNQTYTAQSTTPAAQTSTVNYSDL